LGPKKSLKIIHKEFFSVRFLFYICSIKINLTMTNSLSPITAQALKEQLRNRIVNFYFIKKDGSLREVQGTTRLAHVPADKHPLGVRETPPSVITFWDLLAGDWRSAKVETQFFIKA
jgi:hypothetical protein